MIVKLWGTRGSVASSGPEVKRYGGNTSCVEVHDNDDSLLILDAGTGIRRLGVAVDKLFKRIDIFLTHLHLDHILGLGFFNPLFDPDVEIHIYGPAKSEHELRTLITNYFSPPLFPVLLRDLPSQIHLHAMPSNEVKIGNFRVISDLVIHPGLTVGYRIVTPHGKLAYLPDHEPALGVKNFPNEADWTSGFDLIQGVDLLIHDAQYTPEEYEDHIGWGHSSIIHALNLAALAKVKTLVAFHHDPGHNDDRLDEMYNDALQMKYDFQIDFAKEGKTYYLTKKMGG